MYVQVNFHVMNFILLSILLYKRRRRRDGQRPSFLSALMLALAVHFKASPVVLVLAFLLEFNWKWLLWFAVKYDPDRGASPIAIYGIESLFRLHQQLSVHQRAARIEPARQLV